VTASWNPSIIFSCTSPGRGGCTTYARGVLANIFQEDPQWNRLLPYDQYRLCDVGTAPLTRFPKFNYHYTGFRCTMWMSEQPYSDTPMHTYAIPRSPHVLSQYFPCTTTSRPHKNRAHPIIKAALPFLTKVSPKKCFANATI
jgi:hypothetical protein